MNVKTRMIITLVLTVVFGFLAVTGKISSEQYIPLYTTVLTFYFATEKEVTKNK